MKERSCSLLMVIMTCFLDSLLVVILIRSLGLFWLLTMLFTWSIFWALRDRNVSLIFKTSNMLIEDLDTWAYDLPNLVLLP